MNSTFDAAPDMTEKETVGEQFSPDLLRFARDKTLEVIERAAKEMKPGMSEREAKKIIQNLQKELGAPRAWHAPQIRFGENTVLSFGGTSRTGPLLKENDIFFFDLGPIFENHEGDVGRTFSIGNDPEMIKCAKDVEQIWIEVRDHWYRTHVSGRELYAFAAQCAEARGWQLILKGASGHRVSDFPHIAKNRGVMGRFKEKPTENRWILEIQIRHPVRNFGAFYEDLLN